MKRTLVIPLLVSLAALLCASPASAALVGFQTADHKVGCYLSGKGARCDAKNPRWEAPPKPTSCELDWGQGVTVGRRGPAAYVCAGDTTLDRGHEELAAGDKLKRGRFKCKALDDATVKCLNKRNGHGFAVSRDEVRLFGD